MDFHVTVPALLGLQDAALFALRLVVAAVFGWSGWSHARDPVVRGKSIGLRPGTTRGLGIAEVLGGLGLVSGILIQPAAIGLILVGLGAIGKKAFEWKTGFWGEKAEGWHYDVMLLAMNLVILATAGGRWVLRLAP